MRPRTRRDLFIALSLANLCYLRIWSELLTYTRPDEYLMKLPPGPMQYVAVMLNVLLLGGILFGAVNWGRRRFSKSGFRWVEAAFLLFWIVPLNAIRAVLSNHFDLLRSGLFGILDPRAVELLAGASTLAALFLIAKFSPRLAHVAASVLALLFPFCAVTFGQAVWKIAQYNPSGFAANPPVPPLPDARTSPRFLWVIADEWDYRLTFVDRPAGLALPEIDRLRRDSLFTEQAYPPGPETPISLPGYFTGRLVKSVRYVGPSDLQIRFRDGTGPVSWRDQPSIFTSAHALGFNTALVDWFHPGCRVLSGLTYCDWWEMARQFNSMGSSFGEVLPNQTRSLFETTLISLFGQSLAGHQQTGVYHEILREGLAAANNPEFGLTVIHLPVPHAPHAYDRRTGTFTLGNAPIRGYVDSLALLDRTVGEMRRSLEASGEWGRTTVLFTSDHHYREETALAGEPDDLRIPFLLKMAGQHEGADYRERFNTVLTHDLILEVLEGHLATAADVSHWLDTNRVRAPGL